VRRHTLPLALAAVLATVPAVALLPGGAPDLPVLGPETPRGVVLRAPAAPERPTPKVVDGDVSDWVGARPGLGGVAAYSAGEYVYQDYPNDDFGADDGRDARRLALEDPLRRLEPRTYRLDPLAQALGDEFGVEGPALVSAGLSYGDVRYPPGLERQADIVEVRVAADDDRLFFLVRTAVMTAVPATAVLVLLDPVPGGSYPAPGGLRTAAEWALVVAGDDIIDLRYRGRPAAPPPGVCSVEECFMAYEVATRADGFTNAVELMIRRSRFQMGGVERLGIGIATGVVDPSGRLADLRTDAGDAPDLVNVAFRFDEPVRVRMDREQALALARGSIDRFLATVDLEKLQSGYTETVRPGPGYHDRVYLSRSPVAREAVSGGEMQGLFQHYGVSVPSSYRQGRPAPATFFLHPRSGATTHLAAAWVPGLLRQLGEERGALVVSPSARGSSTWYVGPGHEDFLEVWEDAMRTFSIDPDRVTVAGHSMGGFGSWLLGLLYPDRFAAAFPVSGPVTQGAWLGVGSPIAPQDGGDARAELLFTILENARTLPVVAYQGTNDELVPATGVARMAARLAQLGYRHRLYLFVGQDHYAPLVVDEWAAAARYLDRFRRPRDPAWITYRVWPALERAVETVGVPEGVRLDYAFDGAWWVDDLGIRRGGPDDVRAVGTIDAVSFARGVPRILGVPEAGAAAPGQTAPFVMTGLRWLAAGREAPRNAFAATLENIARARLDVARMGLDTSRAIEGTVSSDGPATLRLAGAWARPPTVVGARSSYAPGLLTIEVGAGERTIRILP
jgi:pimeloyl-ACP methyl ester carboxylesterase